MSSFLMFSKYLWSHRKSSLNLEAGIHFSSSRGSLCHPVFRAGRKDAGLPHRDWEGGRKREKGNLKKGGITSFNTNPLCQLDVNALSEQEAQGSVWFRSFQVIFCQVHIPLPAFLPGKSNRIIDLCPAPKWNHLTSTAGVDDPLMLYEHLLWTWEHITGSEESYRQFNAYWLDWGWPLTLSFRK